jgi:hypothetical protein
MLGSEPNGLILGFQYLRQLVPPVAATELLPR